MDKIDDLCRKIEEVYGLTEADKAAIIGLIRDHKKYGLLWEEKPEDVEERLRDELPVLTEVRERAIVCDDKDAPNHILIEGDNLEALTTLAYTHSGRIDVIYIDPPYNTGNKDFVYNDRYVDSEDEYRHSKWLSFMNKRLNIAKQLLSDKGVIFISIDDNEQAQLKLLCDEVFGTKNFISKLEWRKKTGANDAKDIAIITENILLYSKNHSTTIEEKMWSRDDDSINQNRYRYKDSYFEERGYFYYDTLDRGGLQYSDSMNFGIEAPDGGVIYPNGRSKFINDGWIWKWGKDKVKWGIENGFLEFFKSTKSRGSSYTIKYKVYQKVDNDGRPRQKSGRAYTNLILEPINQQGNSELKNLFNGICPFSNPKPLGLITLLLKTINRKIYTILDFFAGSGTTLHATMQLNAEDGGRRQCILVTNNENNICKEVTYERNRRVIQGYTTPKGEAVEGLKGNNLRYYKTEFVSRDRTSRNMRRLMDLATDMLCIRNNVYTEARLAGKRVNKKVLRYFADERTQMLVVYREECIPQIVPLIAGTPPGADEMVVYVFSAGNYAYDEDFEDVADRVQLCPLPSAIYEAYKRILPKRKPKTPHAVATEEGTRNREEI